MVLEDGERFVCRDESSYNKILLFSFLVFVGRAGKGFTALSPRWFLVAEYFVSLSLLQGKRGRHFLNFCKHTVTLTLG